MRLSLTGISLCAAVRHARRPRVHRGDRVGGDWQWLVLDVDQLERLVGDGQVIGRDGRHRLAEEHYAIDRQQRVRAGLGTRLQLRDVGGGQHSAHAWQHAGPRCIDPFETRVRMRTAQQSGLQQPRQLDVTDVLRATCDLLGSVEARD